MSVLSRFCVFISIYLYDVVVFLAIYSIGSAYDTSDEGRIVIYVEQNDYSTAAFFSSLVKFHLVKKRKKDFSFKNRMYHSFVRSLRSRLLNEYERVGVF